MGQVLLRVEHGRQEGVKRLLGLDEEAGDGLLLPREQPEIQQLLTVLTGRFQVLLKAAASHGQRADRVP